MEFLLKILVNQIIVSIYCLAILLSANLVSADTRTPSSNNSSQLLHTIELIQSRYPDCTHNEIINVLKFSDTITPIIKKNPRRRLFNHDSGIASAISFIQKNGCRIELTDHTQLTNSVTIKGLTAAKNDNRIYTINVPENALELHVAILGGNGDADLYVKHASLPTESEYDCRPYNSGNLESCQIGNVRSGVYYIALNSESSYSEVSLTARYTLASEKMNNTVNTLKAGVVEKGISGFKGEEVIYTMLVPEGVNELSFVMTDGIGDADMYVQFGRTATTSSYDCRPYKSGNSEVCHMSNIRPGIYYIMLKGHNNFQSVSLEGSYVEGDAGIARFESDAVYPIPDNNKMGVSIPIDVNRVGASGIVTVEVNINHAYKADLIVELLHPDGSIYTLHNKGGGSACDIQESYRVNLADKKSSGRWSLKVKDLASGDLGSVNYWKILFN